MIRFIKCKQGRLTIYQFQLRVKRRVKISKVSVQVESTTKPAATKQYSRGPWINDRFSRQEPLNRSEMDCN